MSAGQSPSTTALTIVAAALENGVGSLSSEEKKHTESPQMPRRLRIFSGNCKPCGSVQPIAAQRNRDAGRTAGEFQLESTFPLAAVPGKTPSPARTKTPDALTRLWCC